MQTKRGREMYVFSLQEHTLQGDNPSVSLIEAAYRCVHVLKLAIHLQCHSDRPGH